jgi:hypothetical protein
MRDIDVSSWRQSGGLPQRQAAQIFEAAWCFTFSIQLH